MTKKELIKFILKLIIELVAFVLLVLFIIHLVKSEDGVLAKIDNGNASEKLDVAIKTFTSTDGMKLETAIKSIEGLDDLQINEETGEYNIKIDGQEFLVISREVIPEEENEKGKDKVQVEVKETAKEENKENSKNKEKKVNSKAEI